MRQLEKGLKEEAKRGDGRPLLTGEKTVGSGYISISLTRRSKSSRLHRALFLMRAR